MGSDPTTLPAHHVVGGLWEGAPVRCFEARRDDPNAVVVWVSGPHYSYIDRGDCPEIVQTHDVRQLLDGASLHSLVLDDPLGLGLAGLTARVAERLRLVQCDEPGLPYDSNEICDWWGETGACRLWPSYEARDDNAGLTAISTYLALTDALCAAVGLLLEPGEVAGWERTDILAYERGWWELSTRDGVALLGCGDDMPPEHGWTCHDLGDEEVPHDPLEALEAAWREVCCGE